MSYNHYSGYAPPPGPPQGQHGGYGGYQQPGYGPPPPGPLPPKPYGGFQQPPPPQSSPYPPNGSFAPPVQSPYGPPPASPYGPPPASPYGPPPVSSYGSPPPQAYGGGYGASFGPPPSGPPSPPSPGYGPPQLIQWDARPDAQALRSAMKGFGTNEQVLIGVLATKDPLQIESLRSEYHRMFNRSLEKDVVSETSKWFQAGLVALVRGPLLHDCHQLFAAMDGVGTKEKVLNDVLLSRSNADMYAIKSKFQQTFGKSLESYVKADLSMKTERHFMIVLGGNRAEESAPVIPQQIDQDVMDLYRATEGKVGTDEMMVCSILSSRSDNQIRAINLAYEQKFRRRLVEVIRKEFSGHMEQALLFQLNHAVDKYMHAAALLEDSMAGLGTKDHLLVSRVVRYHWDRNALANIKGAYHQRYKKSLPSRIKGETSGDYRKLMLACVGE